MDNLKRVRMLMIPLALLMAVMLVTAACTPGDIQSLQGVLQNVNSANGTVTIVTNDGKTVTIKITSDTAVAAQGANATAGTLEPGAAVEIQLEPEKQVASRITVQKPKTSRTEDGNQTEDKNKSKETAPAGWGIVEIRATDPPPANVRSAVVYLSNVEVHRVSGNASETDNDSSGWMTLLGAPASFDLVNVIGVEQILGSANLTAGSFTQIRMNVTKVTGVTADNVSFTAEVPGDKLKIVGAFNVGGGNKTVLTMDFDGEKSLIRTGQGKFLFKPVVKLLVNSKGKVNEGESGRTERGNANTGKAGEESRGKGNSGNVTRP